MEALLLLMVLNPTFLYLSSIDIFLIGLDSQFSFPLPLLPARPPYNQTNRTSDK